MDYRLPGSSVHRIFQARILEWVAISFSRRSFRPRHQTKVSCIDRQILYHWATWEAWEWVKESLPCSENIHHNPYWRAWIIVSLLSSKSVMGEICRDTVSYLVSKPIWTLINHSGERGVLFFTCPNMSTGAKKSICQSLFLPPHPPSRYTLTLHTERLIQFSSVTQLCLTLSTPWTASHQASLSLINTQSFLKLMSTESVMPSNHLILCRPLLLLPSIFPSIRVFSNESILLIRWQSTGVSASESVLPMNIQDWFPLGWTGWISLQSKELSRVFSNTTVQKHQFFGAQLYL